MNFIKGALPYYHIDNIDFLEDTSDGSSVIHALSCVAFQPHTSKSSDIIELDLQNQTFAAKYLKNCIKPSKNDLKKNSTNEKTSLLSLLT